MTLLPHASRAIAPIPRASPGMQLRLRKFGRKMEFYAPGLKRWQSSEWKPESSRRFVPISVTGTACALQCDHCRSKVLQGMVTPTRERDLFETAAELKAKGTEGILVSGGSTRSGEVPLMPQIEALSRIKEDLGMRVIVHTGVIDRELARGLASAGVDGVMLDIIGADETVKEVYHLDCGARAFDRSLDFLCERGLKVIPHIVLGLHYGRFVGEDRALDMIASHPVSTLVLVVMTPLVGTPMAAASPPAIEEVSDFFAAARQRLPDIPINLGCGRPMGETKQRLDRSAVDHGLNGIAYPAEGIIEYARASGLEPTYYEYCCSLTWSDL